MGRLVWKNIRNFVGKCRRDNVGAFAAQAAFFILLSAIPFLLFLSALLPYTPVSREDLIEAAAVSMPDYVEPFFVHVLDEAYDRRPGVLSVTALLAVWAAGKGHPVSGGGAERGQRNVRDEKMAGHPILVCDLHPGVCAGTSDGVDFFCLFRLPVSDAAGGRRAGFPDSSGQAADPVDRALFLLSLFFTALFAALPNRKLTFRSQLPGGVACALSWYVFSFFLSVYVNHFQGFGMYGSMTTVTLLMLWLYVCMYIFL